MFRRRLPHRRRILRYEIFPERILRREELQHAHRLMDEGNFGEAAQILERLADLAQSRGMLRRSPHLHLQAARAWFLAQQAGPGERCLRRGLEILQNTQRWQALKTAGATAITELNQLGLVSLAGEIEAWLKDSLAGNLGAASEISNASVKSLPEKCPYCGASLHPDEAEWIDEMAVECPYCGSSIRAESR